MCGDEEKGFPKIFATLEPGKVNIIHHATMSPKLATYYKCCGYLNPLCWCTCLACSVEQLAARTYVQVMENRVEFNYPFACCCKVYDNVGAIYYDRSVATNVEVPGCCSPCFTHCTLYPTCCNLCGEAVIMYGNCCDSSRPTSHSTNCCCRSWIMFPGVADGAALASTLRQARNKAVDGGRLTIKELQMTR